MSEKEIRGVAQAILDDFESGPYYEYLEQVLAQPPDLVVLLQEIEERLVPLAAELYKPFVGQGQLRGMIGALDSLQDYIQETVRLTDDGGWEWVE